MKKYILGLLLVFGFTTGAFAQIENPVRWSYTVKKTGDKTYELHMTANVSSKWHIYAQNAGEGPVPTSFSFAKNGLVSLDGSVKEVGKLEKLYDNNFHSELKFYQNKVDFVQKIKLKSPVATVVNGTVTFMVCDDSKCLPPKDVPFSIKVSGK
ncbi:MAG: protein-disulfide reductase DsbD domain-containing protein [Ferruginibacter sp.]